MSLFAQQHVTKHNNLLLFWLKCVHWKRFLIFLVVWIVFVLPVPLCVKGTDPHKHRSLLRHSFILLILSTRRRRSDSWTHSEHLKSKVLQLKDAWRTTGICDNRQTINSQRKSIHHFLTGWQRQRSSSWSDQSWREKKKRTSSCWSSEAAERQTRCTETLMKRQTERKLLTC